MQDRYGHRISYLRVSITDRCNERCTYCMPQELQEWLPREEILTFEETLRLIRIAADLGVSKVRVTGGEPLTRRDVVNFIRRIPNISGIKSLGLSTNGTLACARNQPGQDHGGGVARCRRAIGQHFTRYAGSDRLFATSPAGIFMRKFLGESMPRSPQASIRSN